MRLRAVIPLVAIAVILAPAAVQNVYAPPSYNLSINPNVPVGLGSTVTFLLSLSGGQRNSAYTVTFDVVKPNGTGSALASKVISTDNRGSGSISLFYPDSSFTALNGTVAIDTGGVYNVLVNQTSPFNIGVVASGQFTASSKLTVVISQPVGGSVVQRGQTTTISATVSALSGPDSAATVYTYTPSNAKLFLPQTSLGVYSINYLVAAADPTGPWAIGVYASDSQGNSGSSSPVTITVIKNDLIVDSLLTYNSQGVPATSFSPGDRIFAFFRIRYSSGTYLTTGQYTVALRNPSGTLVSNLTAAYDDSRFGFYTPTGFPVSTFDPSGTWTAEIDANSMDDGFGNTGPNLTTSVPLQVVVSPSAYWPFIAAAIAAGLAGIILLRRFRTSTEGFEHLETLMGGPLPRGSSILLLGDAGSGKTILSYHFLHEELESGRMCALLSYDAFPEDVQARMADFGWDIISHLRKGRLKIIDCYSGLAGQGEGAIKDPSDLTELNIQVTAFIAKSKAGPVTVILDSLTPIFNGVEEKQAINFIQTVGAKVKKTGGLFIMTASTGALPGDSTAKVKTMSDGVIELNIVRSKGKSRRFLTVSKLGRRKISTDSILFEIDRSRGLVFRVSRFKILKKHLANWMTQVEKVRNIGPAGKSEDPRSGKGPFDSRH